MRERFLVVKGHLVKNNLQCSFGNVYAPNDENARRELWNELTILKQHCFEPWCLGGDFNEVLKL